MISGGFQAVMLSMLLCFCNSIENTVALYSAFDTFLGEFILERTTAPPLSLSCVCTVDSLCVSLQPWVCPLLNFTEVSFQEIYQ